MSSQWEEVSLEEVVKGLMECRQEMEELGARKGHLFKRHSSPSVESYGSGYWIYHPRYKRLGDELAPCVCPPGCKTALDILERKYRRPLLDGLTKDQRNRLLRRRLQEANEMFGLDWEIRTDGEEVQWRSKHRKWRTALPYAGWPDIPGCDDYTGDAILLAAYRKHNPNKKEEEKTMSKEENGNGNGTMKKTDKPKGILEMAKESVGPAVLGTAGVVGLAVAARWAQRKYNLGTNISPHLMGMGFAGIAYAVSPDSVKRVLQAPIQTAINRIISSGTEALIDRGQLLLAEHVGGKGEEKE